VTRSKRLARVGAAVAGALLCGAAGVSLAQMTDVDGARDHPLLPRVPGYYIARFNAKASGEQVFCVGARRSYKVKGSVARFTYRSGSDASALTPPEIRRHYRDLLAKGRVRMTCDLNPRLDAMLLSEGNEIWVAIDATRSDSYEVVVVEREALQGAPSP
jgi:hypothetical protein